MIRQKCALPIGVFDSGMGGLTVLKELKALMPSESFIYLGDTARLPYGTKSKDTVVQYAMQMAELLIKKGIKLLVVACNTATMASLDALKDSYPDLPIVGVIKPGASAAVSAVHRQKNVLVLGTETTVNSNVYTKTINQMDPDIAVANLACGLFVALAEEGCIQDDVAAAVVKKYLSNFSMFNIDCILLGCTHFPLLKQDIQKYAGKSVTIVDSAIETSVMVKRTLETLKLISDVPHVPTCFLVTDLPERFIRIGQLFLQQKIPVKNVEVVNA